VKKGIDKTCEFLIKKLRENAKPVQGTQDIKVPPPPIPDILTLFPVTVTT
jgi:hypothetical protein